MTTKKEAAAIADQFQNDLPELAGRSCRIRQHPASGFNAHTEWYLVPRGPKGGVGKGKYLTFATPGSAVFLAMQTGDILMELNVVNGWKDYNSLVVLPFMENHDFQRPCLGTEFTLDEQLQSAKWFTQFCDPDDWYWLGDLIAQIEEDIKYRDASRCALCGEGHHTDTGCPYY